MIRILVIDDDEQMKRLLLAMLSQDDFEVACASSGEEGARLFREKPFELIVTDIFMPGSSGLDVIVQLKEEYPEVKFIAISGGVPGGSMDLLPVAQSLGAETLRKPFFKGLLLSKIKMLIEGKEKPANKK
jgi:DNA-binding response OmpR family regulator